MHHLLFDGPWAVNSIFLQLTLWQPYFKPAFTKLSTVAIWVQLHNLPVKFCDGEALESISTIFGQLLKIDEFTSSLSKSKYVLICIEIDLAKPLKQGFWIGDNEHRVFVVVLYERLPTFCYKCGLVGHGSNTCSLQSSGSLEKSSPPLCNDLSDLQRQEVRDNSNLMSNDLEAGSDPRPVDSLGEIDTVDDPSNTDYEPWMLVSRRRGHGGGRGSAGGSRGLGARVAYAKSRDSGSLLPNISKVRNNSACVTCDGSSMRGRGSTITARAHVSRNIEDESVPPFDKVTLHMAQDNYPILADHLKTRLESGTPSEARLLSASEGDLTLAPSLSPKETTPPDMPTMPSSPILSKGERRLFFQIHGQPLEAITLSLKLQKPSLKGLRLGFLRNPIR